MPAWPTSRLTVLRISQGLNIAAQNATITQLSKVAACNADVLVAEAGASPLEPYNGATVVDYLGDLTRFTVLCASDPYAVLGVQTAYGAHMTADLVSGPAANTTAATRLVRELSGHRALNLLDRNTYPELVALLKKALSLA